MFGLLPKNLEFFDCFERAAANAVHAANLLMHLTDRGELQGSALVEQIVAAEHAGDKLTHETLDRLERTYLTPIDRDDIHRLISRIDDVVDTIDAIAQRMLFYKITTIKPAFCQMTEVLVRASRSMQEAVEGLRHMKDRKQRKAIHIEQRIVAVHVAEEEGDSIHHRVLGELFESGLDAFQVIKWKELYELVEEAIDFCDDVACIVHGIVLKNA